MPELPEIKSMAAQLDRAIIGKEISRFFCGNEKCLNMPALQLGGHVLNKKISGVTSRGKWILASFSDGARILISLGMGGYLIFHQSGEEPREGYRILLGFSDGTFLSVSFWWFGYFHYSGAGQKHSMVDCLGMQPLTDDFTLEAFSNLLANNRSGVKSLLLNQKKICGIGNFYMQDILWRASLHPQELCCNLSGRQIENLHHVINEYLEHACNLRGASYEQDIYGKPGDYEGLDCGYREGKSCPRCGEKIIKIKTGSTSSFLCRECQKPRIANN